MAVTPLVIGLEADQSDVLAVADVLPQGRERRPGVVVGLRVLPVASVEVDLLEGGVVEQILRSDFYKSPARQQLSPMSS